MEIKKKVALLGLGVVGSGVAELLLQNQVPGLALARVAVKDLGKPRHEELPAHLLTNDPSSILEDPDIQVVVELMGGLHPAREFLLEALRAGKHVVTANKVVIAEEGKALFQEAARRGLFVGFRGTFVGCHPLIHYLDQVALLGTRIKRFHAVLNGTCNYILTSMAREGKAFSYALKEAQEKGYAEKDPALDINGTDTAQKLRILMGLIYSSRYVPPAFPVQGVEEIDLQDIRYADELGYCFRLLGILGQREGTVYARVQPTLVPKNSLLGSLEGANNGIELEDEFGVVSGWVAPGAGRYPTAQAVASDLWDIARGRKGYFPEGEEPLPLGDPKEIASRYYLRFSVVDEPGVLARIGTVFWRYRISIAAVIQKEATHPEFVPLVMTLHPCPEKDLLAALAEIDRMDIVKQPTRLFPIKSP